MTTSPDPEIHPLLAFEHRLVMMSLLCNNTASMALTRSDRFSNFYLDSLQSMDEELKCLFENIFGSSENSPSLLPAMVQPLATELGMDQFQPDCTPVPLKKYHQELLATAPFFAEIYPIYLAAEREKKKLIKETQTASPSSAFETLSPDELKEIFRKATGGNQGCDQQNSLTGQIKEYATTWVSLCNNSDQMHSITRLVVTTAPDEDFSCIVLGQVIARNERSKQASSYSVGDYVSLSGLYNIHPESQPLLAALSMNTTQQAAKFISTVIPARFLNDNSVAYRVEGRSEEFMLDGRLGRALIVDDTNANRKIILSHHFPVLAAARYGDAFLSPAKIGDEGTIKLDDNITQELWGLDYNS